MYIRTIPQEEAPLRVSCVTAVRYILLKSSEGSFLLPKAYIGDMAHYLLRYYGAQIVDIIDTDAQL